MTVWTDLWEYGLVAGYMCLTLGTFTVLTFLIALIKKDSKWDFYVWHMNVIYLFGALVAIISDSVLRFAMPSVFCSPEVDDPTSCDRTWNQLCWSWAGFVVAGTVWYFIIKRMAFFAFRADDSDYKSANTMNH